jgi:hypothetical protein
MPVKMIVRVKNFFIDIAVILLGERRPKIDKIYSLVVKNFVNKFLQNKINLQDAITFAFKIISYK